MISAVAPNGGDELECGVEEVKRPLFGTWLCKAMRFWSDSRRIVDLQSEYPRRFTSLWIGITAKVRVTGCGIDEAPGTGVSGNTIINNTVSDAYCGVAAVEADFVVSGTYINTLYPQLDADLYPSMFPPVTQP